MTYGSLPLRSGHAMSLQRFVAGRNHVPASHPVLVRLHQILDSRTCVLPPVSSVEVADMNDHLDYLAGWLAKLPEQHLTRTQRERIGVIVDELLRRARQ